MQYPRFATSWTRSSLAFAAGFLLCAGAWAQTASILIRTGDAVPGVGSVIAFPVIPAVNNCGDWVINVVTDNADLNQNGALLRNGSVIVREGDAVAQPANAFIQSIGQASINDAGRVVYSLGLGLPAGGGLFALYTDGQLSLSQGQITTAPQFTPGTSYLLHTGFELNEQNQLVIVGAVNDVNIIGPTDRTVILAELDANGLIVAEDAILVEGDSPPELAPAVLQDFSTFANTFDVNDAGDVMVFAHLTDTTTPYNSALMQNRHVIARRGFLSPFEGRTWDNPGFTSDVNNHGAVVFRGDLSGSTADDEVIVRDGTSIVAREGDLVNAATGSWPITNFAQGQVEISDSGEVFWLANWDDIDPARGAGLFVDGHLLVQQGVTTVNGFVIEALGQSEVGVVGAFEVSDDGRYVIFGAGLSNGDTAVIQIDRGERMFPFCAADGSNQTLPDCPCGNTGAPGRGCTNSSPLSVGALLVGTGSPTVDSVVLQASGMPANAVHLFVQGNAVIPNGVVFGDGLRCVGGNVLRLATHNATLGASSFPGPGEPSIRTRAEQLGQPIAPCSTRLYQVVYRDPSPTFCPAPSGSTWNTTNGIQITWP